jgi:peptidoglycan/LPS O-acetylase OafA/YrhL
VESSYEGLSIYLARERVIHVLTVVVSPNLPGPTDAPPRLHGLDGLRGIAAALVLGHHLGASGFGDKLTARGYPAFGAFVGSVGASGVELFFVLSGVVLVRPYLRYGRHLHLATYLRRRAMRLFPPYLGAWLLAGLSAYVLTNHATWYSATSELPRFSVGTWIRQAGILYFGGHYNWAWWSLTVEVLFYLLIPLLVPLLVRLPDAMWPMLAVLSVSLAGALLARCLPTLNRVLPHELWKFLIYSPCFTAGLMLSRRDFPRPVASILLGAGVALVVSQCLLPRLGTEHAGYCLVYTAIVSRVMDPADRLSRALSGWHLVWFGERSYSLFLTHCSVIVLVYDAASTFIAKGAAFLLVTRLVAVPLCALVAMLLFSYVERRFAHGLVTADAFWPLSPHGNPGLRKEPSFADGNGAA